MIGINLWNCSIQNKKQKLWKLIKFVAEHWKEIDKNFIAEYAKEVFNNNSLDAAIKCFEDLADQAKWIKPEDFRNDGIGK